MYMVRFLSTGSKKMKKSDLDNMIARLAGSSQNKTPDARRIQGTEERIKRGVTASYAWQGKSVLQRNLTLPVANHHAQYKTLPFRTGMRIDYRDLPDNLHVSPVHLFWLR